jgi:hypothetical protein
MSDIIERLDEAPVNASNGMLIRDAIIAIRNARLIAAAPDMAEALIELVQGDTDIIVDTSKARAALEKAGWKP